MDIGCGLGGLARYAAERHGCTVTTVNISREQLHYACNFCKGLPVQLKDCDYRPIDGRKEGRWMYYWLSGTEAPDAVK